MMRKVILSILLAVTVIANLVAQDRTTQAITLDFNREYGNLQATLKGKKINFNTVGNQLLKLLIEIEKPTEFSETISPAGRQLIASKDDPYTLIVLERAIKEDQVLIGSLHFKEKLLREVSTQINLLMQDKYPYYNYNTTKKQVIKFFSIRSGNDLFTLTGLYDLLFLGADRYVKDGGTFFQRNDDRDYTGSLLIEIGTDYLRTLRRRPLKTYQTVLFGFDVYTPYFKSALIFPNDSSFNALDRPHACFQYFGWSKKGISRQDKFRWTTTVKFGKIGGKAGAKFQNALHQDISYSPRPRGWAAQISNGGRIGFSIELKQEFFQYELYKNKLNPNSWRNLYISLFSEQKLGTYMTNGTAGLQVSNRRLAENNQNFINHRTRQTVRTMFDHFMYSISFSGTYVKHNTMLEGYGLFSTRENDNDPLTPASRYYLTSNQVRRVIGVMNTTLSYTTRYGTIFYNWKSFSPETKMGKIGINSPASGIEMDISKRWHHFAEIGFTFNTH